MSKRPRITKEMEHVASVITGGQRQILAKEPDKVSDRLAALESLISKENKELRTRIEEDLDYAKVVVWMKVGIMLRRGESRFNPPDDITKEDLEEALDFFGFGNFFLRQTDLSRCNPVSKTPGVDYYYLTTSEDPESEEEIKE